MPRSTRRVDATRSESAANRGPPLGRLPVPVGSDGIGDLMTRTNPDHGRVRIHDRRIVALGLGLGALLLAGSAVVALHGMRELDRGDFDVERAIAELESLASLTTDLAALDPADDGEAEAKAEAEGNSQPDAGDRGTGGPGAEVDAATVSREAREAAVRRSLADVAKAVTDPERLALVDRLHDRVELALTTVQPDAQEAGESAAANRSEIEGAITELRSGVRERIRSREELGSRISKTSLLVGTAAALAACLTLFFFYRFHRHVRRIEHARTREALLAKRDLRYHEALLHSAGDAVVTADASGHIISMNGLAEELTGWTQQESLGRTIEGVLRLEKQDDRRWAESNGGSRRISTRDTMKPYRTVLLTKDGSRRAIEENTVIYRDERGARRGVVVVFRDITRALQNESALRERVHLAEFEAEVGASLLADMGLEQILASCAEIIQRRLDGAFTSIWIDRDPGRGLELMASAGDSHLPGYSEPAPRNERMVRRIAESRGPLLLDRVVGDERVIDVIDQAWAERERLVAFAGFPALVEDRLVGVVAMFTRHELSQATLQSLALVAGAVASTVERKLAERQLEQREARFRSLVIASTQLVWRADPNGLIVEEISAWRSLSGEEFESFHGDGWLAHVHPDDRDRVTALWRSGIESKSTFSFELRLRRSDGEFRRMSMRAVPIVDGNGAILEWIGTHTDITERRTAEESLRESEDRYRALVELSPQAVWLADATGRITYANQWWLEYSGQTLDDLAGPNGFDAIRPDLRDRLRGLLHELLGGSAPWTLEAPLRRASDGEYRWHFVRALPILGPDARPLRWVGIAIDIDDRMRSERERERLAFLVENSCDFIGIYGTDGRVSYMNRTGKRLVGLEDHEILASIALTDFVHEDERPLVSEILLPRAERDGTANVELRVVHRSTGSPVWMDFSILTMKSAAGEVEGIATISRDITERKLAQEEIASSQRFLRSAIDALDSSIAVLDEHGTILTVNDSWRQFVDANGLEPDHYEVGASYLEYWENDRTVARESVDLVVKAIREVIAGTTRTAVVEYCLPPREDGANETWLQMRVTRFAEQGPARVVVAHENITPRVQSELATKRRSEQLQRLAKITTDLSVRHDVESILAVVTEGARSIIGARRSTARVAGETGGAPDVEFSSADDPSATPLSGSSTEAVELAILRRVRRTNHAARVTGEDLAADPEWASLAPKDSSGARGWLAAPLDRLDGGNDGAILLTDRMEGTFSADDEAVLVQLAQMASIAIENARLYGRLVRADRRKDEFLATLAHELRNPLAPIRFWLEIMKSDPSHKAIEGAHATIARQIGHMVRLIDDLLDLSRISFDKLELRKERVNAADVVESAIEASLPAMEAKEQILETDLGRSRVVLDADPTRVSQIVSNLLNNASKYSGHGGRIALSVRSEDGFGVIVVADEGIGIPQEALPRIFDPFVQDDRARPRAEGGLGIGLSLVRRIVELHGGSVAARSSGPGLGSEFEVRLPLAAEPPAASSPPEPPESVEPVEPPEPVDPAVSRPAEPAGDSPAPTRRRILIVDDNRDSTESLARLLELCGHECRSAVDGLDALRVAEEFRPQVALLDIGLPGLDGHELARRFRATEWGEKTILVAVTGWGQPEDRVRSRAVGFDLHLVKPIDVPALLKWVDEFAAR